MIQTIRRVSEVLSHLSEADSLALKALAEKTGIKRTALANIMGSLTTEGLVERIPGNGYCLGPRLIELAKKRLARHSETIVAEEETASLAEVVGGLVVVSRLVKGYRYIVAAAHVDTSITVNPRVERRPSIYDTATGRVLLAFSALDDREQIRACYGEAGSQWPELTSEDTDSPTLGDIRSRGFAQCESNDGMVTSTAVPVWFSGQLWGGLGCSLPRERLGTQRGFEILLRQLKEGAARLAFRIGEAQSDRTI